MKILMTNRALSSFSGSETWTYTVAQELSRCGHNVHVFSPQHGIVTQKIAEFARIIWRIGPNAEYDLVLINHRPCLECVALLDGFKIYTCHGLVDLEQPGPMVNAIDVVVAVSNEVHDHLWNSKIESVVIPNGVNCKRFRPMNELRERPTVLSLCQNTKADNLVQQACNRMGLEYVRAHRTEKPIWYMEETINEADIVVSLGRGAIEAMACGRNVVVMDSRRYIRQGEPTGDGLLCEQNIEQSAEFNYSGRCFAHLFDLNGLCAEFERYNPEMSVFYRAYTLELHDAEKTVDAYLKLASERTNVQ